MVDVSSEIGRVVPFHTARDPISVPVLRSWCDAMGVTNPCFTDQEAAAGTRAGRIVMPLAMLDVWTKPGLSYTRDVASPHGAVFDALDGEGLTSAAAVSSVLVQHRPLVVGELLTSTIEVEAVSPDKSTALGRSRFVTTRQEFLVEGAAVGHVLFTVMKYRPSGDSRTPVTDKTLDATDGASDGRRAFGSLHRDATGTILAPGLRVGMPFPAVVVPVTNTLIVAGALMTSDYFDAHHDRDAALRRGSKDIFMNIHTTLGIIERCAGDWLGPDVLWCSMSVRLGVPNYPGDTMTVTGEVTSVDPSSGETVVAVRAGNSLGLHASGHLAVVLPA